MYKIDILSTRKCGKKHVSYDTILGMEDLFSIRRDVDIVLFQKWIYLVGRIIEKIIKHPITFPIDSSVIKKTLNNGKMHMFIDMDYGEIFRWQKTLRILHNSLIIYVFDCWEPNWKRFEELFNKIEPVMICFAYKKSQEHFESISQGRYRTCFIPQSMDDRYFYPRTDDKKRLFIQIGRRTDSIHKMALDYLNSHNIPVNSQNYVFEQNQGALVFKEKNQFAEEISASYFFLVAPKNLEHHSQTGDISEVTARFFEAMASKSLCVGIKPRDSFDVLFPYRYAMVEVTEESFDREIDELIADQNKYRFIVDHNYNYLMKNHKWENRYDEIINILQKQ